MTAAGDILGTVPTMQSIALLGSNVKIATKKNVKMKDIIGSATKNIVGIELIKATATAAKGL